ncbi:MAG: hypothetical protein ACLQGP_35660 [Isosphaeraceae bacterium]
MSIFTDASPAGITRPATETPAPPRSTSTRWPGWRSSGTDRLERIGDSLHTEICARTLDFTGGTLGKTKRPARSVFIERPSWMWGAALRRERTGVR